MIVVFYMVSLKKNQNLTRFFTRCRRCLTFVKAIYRRICQVVRTADRWWGFSKRQPATWHLKSIYGEITMKMATSHESKSAWCLYRVF